MMLTHAQPAAAKESTSKSPTPAQLSSLPAASPSGGAVASLRAHWPEYAMEAALLGTFMLSACLVGVVLEFPTSPVHQVVSSGFLRRMLGGIAMGVTAICLVYSPWGKQSGAQINPSVTLSFFRLGKMKGWDAVFYIVAQFFGSAVAVALLSLLLRPYVSHRTVNYAVTIPGPGGAGVAFIAELVISFLLMTAVLNLTANSKLARFTGLLVGAMVATFITVENPLSGMSMNPARTLGSALSANVWTAIWVYFTAPPLAMLAAVELDLTRSGRVRAGCAKLHHENSKRCIFCGANGGFES